MLTQADRLTFYLDQPWGGGLVQQTAWPAYRSHCKRACIEKGD